MPELISLREFGKKVGASHVGIKKAIDAGYILKGFVNGKIDYDVAKKEWDTRPVAKTEKKKKAQATNSKKRNGIENITIQEAKRREAVFKAERAQLDVEELRGKLVRKDVVMKELFAAGQEVRITLQSIPDKEIDNILAASTRNEALSILNTAIVNALESLSFENVKL